MESNLLQNAKKCAIVEQHTAPSLQPQPSRYLLVYFQERRRALMTELKAVDEALKELKVQSAN